MVNSRIKRIEILGTRGLSKSTEMIVYNTRSFTVQDTLDSLGIKEGEAKILREQPTLETVERIAELLTDYKVFQPIVGKGDLFLFENNKYDEISGHGFDTIIFLKKGEVLGYIALMNSECGSIVTLPTDTLVKLRRNYTVGTVSIYLDRKENTVRVDQDTISLLNTVNLGVEDKDWSEIYLNDVKKIKTVPSYSSKLTSVHQSRNTRNTYTEGILFHVEDNREVTRLALRLSRNITLGEFYKPFNHYQVDYYLQEPAIYVWDDWGNYSIFSLVQKLSDVVPGFSDDSKPLPLTVSKVGVSDSELYHIDGDIDYFSGQYLITKDGRLFNIESQEWTSTKNFIADTGGNITFTETLSWPDFESAVNEYPHFSNTHANSGGLLLEGDVPYRRIGDWLVLKNSRLVTYTNFTKTIRFKANEEKPIIINGQVLIGKDGDNLTFYRHEGYFCSKSALKIIGKEDQASYGKPYHTENDIFNISSFKNYADIQRSPLGMFRKNYGPEKVEKDFNIIGSLSGIIYYKQGDIINYL